MIALALVSLVLVAVAFPVHESALRARRRALSKAALATMAVGAAGLLWAAFALDEEVSTSADAGSPAASSADPGPVAPVPPVPPPPAPRTPPRDAVTLPQQSPAWRGPCVASWYGEDHRGLTTASGEPFDPDRFTVAAWDYAFGTRLEVKKPATGDTVTVEVTDRGPARRLDRCLDLSAAAFAALAPLGRGLIDVTYREVDGG